jgi:hypothetical protein
MHDRFVQKEPIVHTGKMIDDERRDEIKLRPKKSATDGSESGTKASRE